MTHIYFTQHFSSNQYLSTPEIFINECQTYTVMNCSDKDMANKNLVHCFLMGHIVKDLQVSEFKNVSEVNTNDSFNWMKYCYITM